MQEVSVSDVTLNIMKRRVLSKKSNGEQETPLDAYKRAARFVASGHAKFSPNDAKQFENKIIETLADSKFMPNTPTLVNAGFPRAQCSACFVIPIEDNIQSIYKAHYNQGLIQASGGGFGAYFGNIRSTGTLAAGRFATKGPVSWIKMFNENASHVVQGMREGANMAMLDIGHPDIVDFITCKNYGYNLNVEDLIEQFGVSIEEAKRIKSIIGIEKFNISVSVTDKFMETLDRGGDWYLIDPHTKNRVKTIPAKELWDLLINNAHKHGEPGVIFIDEINRKNSLDHISKIEACNACAELPMIPYGACNLGHINLSKFVDKNGVRWDELEDVTRFGVQFLDDIIDINTFPIPELTEANLKSRQIGLGVMGWADALIKLGVPYDSDKAIETAHGVGSFIDSISYNESEKLGKDRGNYPYFDGSKLQKSGQKYMRNSNRTTIAPTGQTSTYAGCSSGIEPIMFPVIRREQAGMVQIDYHPILFNVLNDRGFNTQEIKDKIGVLGSVRNATFLPEDIRNLFPSAHDISYEWHIKHQAAWQEHITASISKTINFPNDAKASDISSAYWMAYKSGCKGVTVYRDGSRLYQPLSSLKKKNDLVQLSHKRSEVTHGTNRKIQTGCSSLMIFCGDNPDGLLQEITCRMGKSGGCLSSFSEGVARIVSIALQHGVPAERIIKQLSNLRCHLPHLYKSKHTGDRPRTITSCCDAIAVAMEEHLLNGSDKKLEHVNMSRNHDGVCPDCGVPLMFIEGCAKCSGCGFSRCS